MVVVVSDTSPVRALAHLRLLDVLAELFGEVFVPQAVAEELLHPPARLTGVDVRSLPGLTVRQPDNEERVAELRAELDAGEAEAIALAEELRAEALLIDEAAGRNVASQLGLPVLGTLGILLIAKQRGLVREIRPLLNKLQDQLKFYISPNLRDDILRLARELPEG